MPALTAPRTCTLCKNFELNENNGYHLCRKCDSRPFKTDGIETAPTWAARSDIPADHEWPKS